MHESSRLHPALKRALAATPPRAVAKLDARPLGMDAIDRLLGGGLARGKLHEVFPQEAHDEGGALGFAAMLALCVTGQERAAPLLWLREDSAPAPRRLAWAGPRRSRA